MKKHEDINRKTFPIGSVVYYVKRSRNGDNSVAYGIVEEHYTYEICLQLYELKDKRLINGVPIMQFETPTRWNKLPKGWSYDTKLFDIDYGEHNDAKNYNVAEPGDILKAIADGVLVKVQDNDHAHIEAEIDKRMGWRIVRRYPPWENHSAYISLKFSDVYPTYDEAKAAVEQTEKELKRQSELSDYDWSVEQIDKSLGLWQMVYSKTYEDVQKKRSWLMSLDNIEDVETRVLDGEIEWKYYKNKKWMKIEA